MRQSRSSPEIGQPIEANRTLGTGRLHWRATSCRWVALVLLLAATSLPAQSCREASVGLVLGSGGAGGLAHIAMLEVFEDLDLRPDAIAGTSIGAIIGALYAAGLEASEIADLFREFGGSALDPLSGLTDDGPGWRELIDLDLANGGVIDADGFIDFIAERFEARTFSELELPLAIVATNYWSGEAHVFRSGDLLKAIEASMAVPGLFKPVALGDELLIDGGASNPLPLDLLEGHEWVIAIDVTGTRAPNGDEAPGLTDLLFTTFEIMQQSIIRAKVAQHPAEIYIKPDLEGIRLLHFDRVDAILESVEDAADELRRQLEGIPDCRAARAG